MAQAAEKPVSQKKQNVARPEPRPRPERNGRPSAREMEERLVMVSQWLLESHLRADIALVIQSKWQVGQRMAQRYIQEAERRLASEALQQDRDFYLTFSQLQREKLVGTVFRYVQAVEKADPAVLNGLTRLINAALKVLDSRDRIALALHELREAGGARVPTPTDVAQFLQEMEQLVEENTENLGTFLLNDNPKLVARTAPHSETEPHGEAASAAEDAESRSPDRERRERPRREEERVRIKSDDEIAAHLEEYLRSVGDIEEAEKMHNLRNAMKLGHFKPVLSEASG